MVLKQSKNVKAGDKKPIVVANDRVADFRDFHSRNMLEVDKMLDGKLVGIHNFTGKRKDGSPYRSLALEYKGEVVLFNLSAALKNAPISAEDLETNVFRITRSQTDEDRVYNEGKDVAAQRYSGAEVISFGKAGMIDGEFDTLGSTEESTVAIKVQ